MNYKASFCDPFKPDVIDLGIIEEEKVIQTFESYDWNDYLENMESAKDSEIFYSPSFEVENVENKHAITLSAIEDNKWYVFYKRPKLVKKLFGLREKMDENYVTEVFVQSDEEALSYLSALLNNKLQLLDEKIK